MIRPLSLIIVAWIALIPSFASGQETVRVMVFPFAVHAQEDLTYLGDEIPEAIKNHLKQEGAQIIEPDRPLPQPATQMTAEDYRKFGIGQGADFVIWGSMTRIGQRFSLDGRMVEPFSDTLTQAVFKAGEKIENLPATVKELSRSLGMKIFKQQTVAEVKISGNKRIETDAILRVIQTGAGDAYSAKDLSRDLKAVYGMGYFDDVRIESEDVPKGKTVIFKVKEKPTTRYVRFKGNRAFDDEKLSENLSISTGSILNVYKLEKNVKRIETLYKDKNFHNIKVSYNILPLENEQADLEFIIDEGEKIWIRQIAFEGNSAFSDKALKKLMKTSEKGFLSWLTSSGDLNTEDLEQDVDKIAAFYSNNGYIRVKVSDPEVDFRADGIYVKLKIEEGPRFKVGRVDIDGDIILTAEALKEKIKIGQEEYYNREIVRNDVLALTDLYSDHGYAYASITPRTEMNPDTLQVDITYTIAKGKEVYFERILIEGNTITRDKVIRRELNVFEKELYSGVRLKRGVFNLHRLDYFEDVKVNTERGSSDDAMILKIGVTEKPTGAFSFGGGYSNDESFFGMASISQKNLFGRGQTLELKGQIGGTTDKYTLSFVEPWFMDIPLSAGFDLYNWDTDYDDYDKDATGGRVRFSYPVYDFTRASLSYTFEVSDVTNIDEDASNSIKSLAGNLTMSSIKTGLQYDSRDKVFNPTEGQHHVISVEYAGLGGDIAFTKYLAETGWYIPLLWDVVGFIHGKGGYVTENSGGVLPDYYKFYLGGINSIRGFEWRGISLEDEDGADIGGEKFVQANVELLIPLIKKAGLVGVLFYDTGNVYGKDDSIDLGQLRESVGYGFRWYSPIGPIRIENGYILDPKPDEDDNGRWEFSMGAAF